jgi:histidyl-tRNA synthetase
LGAQNGIGGGGRYDRLMELYGGQPTPGLGFALGFERTMLAMQAAGVEAPRPDIAEVYVARTVPELATVAFEVTQRLRADAIAAEMDHQGRSLKAQMKVADRLGASLVVLVGPDEVAAGEVTLRDMDSKTERRVEMARLTDEIYEALADRSIDEAAGRLQAAEIFDEPGA